MKIKDALSEITIPSSLDEITDRAINRAIQKRAVRAKMKKNITVFATTILLFVGGITIVQPVWAKEIPFLESVFEYVNEYLTVSGDYGKYTDKVQETAEDNGVGIDISEIYCDGENLFISYIIHSKQAFSTYAKGDYHQSQILTEDINLILESKGTKHILDTSGYGESMVGKFVDDHTFAGAACYMDEKDAFPKSFSLNITIPSLKLQDDGKGADHLIPGVWQFSVPVKVNQKDIQTILPNVSREGHSIDRVVISPLLVTIDTSFPDIYLERDSIDLLVQCFSDKSDLPIPFDGIAGETTAFNKLSRSDVSGTLRIYVVDAKDMEKDSANENSEDEVKKYAIVYTTISL